MKKKAPILISVPHGGNEIPDEVTSNCVLNDWELFDDTDALSRELFDFKDRVAAYIDTNVARTIIDLNRSREDLDPKNPDGVIKSRTAKGATVFKKGGYPNKRTTERLLRQYYDPFHSRIEQLLAEHPFKFALDCHSMDPTGPKFGKRPGEKRPLFCLCNGGDSSGFPIGKKGYITCSPTLIINFAEILSKIFKISEDEVLLNEPFPGGHIIRSHYSDAVPWIQLEINKSLYLTPETFDKGSLTCFPGVTNSFKEKLWIAIQKLLNLQ